MDIRLNAAQYSSVPNGADGFPVLARGMRDGSLSTADFLNLKCMEGRVFQVDVGAFSTGIRGGGAGDAYDQDQPEAFIGIPTGTTMILNRVAISLHTPLLATDADECECLIAVDRAATVTIGTTQTTETALNMRTDNPRSSNCSCYSAATANITNPTLGIELGRKVITGDMNGNPANALWGDFNYVYEPKVKPIIVGPAALYVYWGCTVAAGVPGFAQIQWVEVPSTDITG